MFRGCLGQLFVIFVIGALVLWFFRAPESVAALIIGFVDLIISGADSLGRFASSLAPLFNNLL
ncbi:hypothetical protein [Nocardiopsis sp. CC223A]|uniref:hypothetical protein n=1 Tax=Nocardiopsis sp. CC223A TaxID=3044051 RepID=UPI00278BCAED|nr:hypothetical protein [Nocardiopsis sp. CC223A]